jgi:hypothetical protein
MTHYQYVRIDIDGTSVPKGWHPVGKPIFIAGAYWSVLCEWRGEGQPPEGGVFHGCKRVHDGSVVEVESQKA